MHKARLEKRSLPNAEAGSWRAVEQSLEEYDEWKGQSALMPRVTLDTVAPIGENVEHAFTFLAR
jgi:hypothetical protein